MWAISEIPEAQKREGVFQFFERRADVVAQLLKPRAGARLTVSDKGVARHGESP
jgi:hypothetical protein